MPIATLSATARRDVAAAATWIAKDSQKAALHFQKRVRAALILLGEHPQAGVERPQWAGAAYRFFIIPDFPYVLVYNAQRKPPVIMRILHGAQDLTEILKTLPSAQER
jgi:toxin ParE1/3/4